jgi:signal transduction histidine kinase
MVAGAMTNLLTARRYLIVGVSAAGLLLLIVAGVLAHRSISLRGPLRPRLYCFAEKDDWQAFGGTWQFANGVMSNNSDERGAKLMNGSSQWADYVVEADVLLLGEYGDAGIIIRANDEEEGVDAYHGYMAGLRDLDNTLILGRADYGWREFVAKSVSPRVYDQQWYHLKFLAYGCTLAVSATSPTGQTSTAAVEDPGCVPSGRFGLKSYNTGAQWRNVTVRSATRQDLVDMIGSARPPLAVPGQFPTGAEPGSYDKYFEPIQRALLEHRADVNAQPISSLRLLSPNRPTPVTIHGVVTLTSPVVFVQDPTGGLAMRGSHTQGPLQIGDEIEARGDAELHDFSSVLRNGDVHVLWSHTPVLPISVTASQAASGALDAEFIEVQGRLEDQRTGPDGSHILTLDESGQTFLAIAGGASSDKNLRHLKNMSRLRLRGICVVDPAYTHDLTSFAVLLPSFNDVEIIEGPPWWSAGHIVALIIGALLLALASLIAYILIERWRMQAVLDERERLAHEMHDTLAQSFAGIGFQLEAIQDEAGEESHILPQLGIAREMVRNSHEEARRSIATLRPENLESTGLLRALEKSAHRLINGSSSISVTAAASGSERTLPLRISDTLLRIGHEAIANAVRHARATGLVISLCYEKDSIELIVEDNGCGFLISSESAGFGIRGMGKRADGISARFTMVSTPGSGTAVHVLAPLPASSLRTYLQRIPWQNLWKRRSYENVGD